MARFANPQHSNEEAIGTLADELHVVGHGAYEERTEGAVTLTPAQLINGVIKQGGSPGAFAMTYPTAAAIVAAIANCQVGSRFEFDLINGGDGTITMTTNTGISVKGTATIATSKSQHFVGIVTAVDTPAVTIAAILTAAT